MLLDTVHLWAKWTKYTWSPGTGDWWRTPPRNNKKYKKFYNDSTTGWSVIIDEHNGLRIEGSVPRAVKGNNFESISEEEFPELKKYIVSLCKGRCVKVDLADLIVCRVDLARNKELDFAVSGLIKEVGKIKEYGTMAQSKSKEFHGLTYVRWENKQRETVLYDKIEEMIDKLQKGKISEDTIPDGEWVRSEVRLLQSTSCRSEGIRTIDDLKDNDKQWALWKEENRRIVRRARELGHYANRVAEPSKEFFRMVRKYTTEGKQTHELVKLIAGVTGVTKFLGEFGGRTGFYEWLDVQKIKGIRPDTWRKRKDRLRETMDEIIKYRTWYMTKAKPSLIWETYHGWVDAGEMPPPD